MTASADLVLSHDQADELAAFSTELGGLASIEAAILGKQDLGVHFDKWCSTASLREAAKALWARYDYIVVRNVPPSVDGSTGLLLARAFFPDLKSYRHSRIVKQFRMSPWTTELSHTLADGHFHTDLNTAERPPAATIMQCLAPDPDAPRHGQLRVVSLKRLLEALQRIGDPRVLRFFTQDQVVMTNGKNSETWSGQITDGNAVRFHPETLRSAQRQHAANASDLEDCLATVHETALGVAHEIGLARGEVLMVSNRRALHQRGACTVRFRSFPRDFESRVVAVLHALEEPA